MAAKTLLVGVLLAVAVALGCGEDGGGAGTTGGGTSSEALAPPGLYERDDGSVQALGLLTYRGLEGGFWAVVDTFVPKEADTASIVAVVLPDEAMASTMSSLRNEYVSVIGARDDGPNVYQAGPIVRATSIDRVVDQIVE
jgi:hypothetical protein